MLSNDSGIVVAVWPTVNEPANSAGTAGSLHAYAANWSGSRPPVTVRRRLPMPPLGVAVPSSSSPGTDAYAVVVHEAIRKTSGDFELSRDFTV